MIHFLDNRRKRARIAAWAAWFLVVLPAAGCAFHLPAEPITRYGSSAVIAGAGSWWLLLRRMHNVPVLNYHSISENAAWLGHGCGFTLHPDMFAEQLAWLARHGYRSLFISELRDAMNGSRTLADDRRSVALTLDDGYADNWVAALPLLRRYGIRATVFVNPAFVDGERPPRRVRGEDRDGLEWEGYLSWPELEAMRDSGLIEIQSHGYSHDRVFTGTRPLRFAAPTRSNAWLLWQLEPDRKPAWWKDPAAVQRMSGHPIFAQQPGLCHRAYRPDRDAVAHMQAWAAERGAEFFAEPAAAQTALRDEWRAITRGPGHSGTFESRAEYLRRVLHDLQAARRAIRERLDVPADVLCWPENAFTAETEALARDAGYTATVSNRHNTLNRPHEAPERLGRVGIAGSAPTPIGRWLSRLNFVAQLQVFEGRYAWYPLCLLVSAGMQILNRREAVSKCAATPLSTWD